MAYNNNTSGGKLSEINARLARALRAVTALAGAAALLWLERGRLDHALLWAAVIGVAVVYPTARFAARQPDARTATPAFAFGAVCCAGGLVVLWALGAPPAAMVLVGCGLLGAVAGALLARSGQGLPLDVTAAAFFGGALLLYSWLGLAALALGAWLSRARGPGALAGWIVGLGLAWGVYLPALTVWSVAGFWWGFVRWLGA